MRAFFVAQSVARGRGREEEEGERVGRDGWRGMRGGRKLHSLPARRPLRAERKGYALTKDEKTVCHSTLCRKSDKGSKLMA